MECVSASVACRGRPKVVPQTVSLAANNLKRLAAQRQAFLLFFYLSVQTDDPDLKGDVLATLCKSFAGCHFQAAAAGDFHADQGDVLDGVLAQDFRQLFGVVNVIEFRAADESDAPFDEIFVETGVSIGSAVGCDEKAGAVEVWRMWRDQFDLYRPLAQTGYRRNWGYVLTGDTSFSPAAVSPRRRAWLPGQRPWYVRPCAAMCSLTAFSS